LLDEVQRWPTASKAVIFPGIRSPLIFPRIAFRDIELALITIHYSDLIAKHLCLHGKESRRAVTLPQS
jgi:hypothetical protein